MSSNNNNNNKKKNSRFNQTIIMLIVAIVFTYLGVSCMGSMLTNATTKEIQYSEFVTMVEEGKVDSVVFDTAKIYIYPKKKDEMPTTQEATTSPEDPTLSAEDRMEEKLNSLAESMIMTYYTGYLYDESILDLLEEHDVKYKSQIKETNVILQFIIQWVVPFLLIYLILGFVMRKVGGGMGGVGKSNAKMYVQRETGVTFKDVAGQDEAKESLKEIVDFLHNPTKYVKIGAKLPKGALLVGPPGTGKTLLAKAVAGEAHVPFFSLSGSDFVEMFVGVGASRVRDLFKQAQASAPCIVFIDEIDAIGKSRDSRYGGGNDEREQTLNQLLSEMDGFDTSKGLLVLAATNRPEVLDKALLRPGRFDRRIIVDKPDLRGRLETLKVHSKDVLMDDTVDLEEIAKATSGAVGSDLANMINEAAINAVKDGRNVVSQKDLFESVEVVIAGKEKKDRILSKEEKKVVAYHEVGHALITCLRKNAEPVQKITIVPRTKGALGYVMQVPEEEKYLMSKDEMMTELIMFCGGRAAEELIFDSVTTGAANDIERATSVAKSMITRYGMSDAFGFMGLATIESQYLDAHSRLDCSPETAKLVDDEIKKLLSSCYEEAKRLLSENIDTLHKIADFLYEKETITGKQFMEIYNEVKGIVVEEEPKEENVEENVEE